MCAIIGGVNVTPEWVESGLEHQKMRGPDNTGIRTIGNVIFGHNLLSIIGNQPQPIIIGRYMMTYNGEIYNYKDLYPYETSDTICLGKMLWGFGVHTISKLNGMFAFAFYSEGDHEIHLAVDRFGQKPLYYYHEGETFAFASTPAALYALNDKWELDRDALQSYWLLGSTMGENGLFKGVKKLCASEHLTYNVLTNTVKIERYWEPKYVNPLPE